jgi:hypothetical protein
LRHILVAGRLFNEKEVSEILKRASSIRSGGDVVGSGGINLEELQQVASELGYDPAHIELAARQLGAAPPQSNGFLGGRVILDRTVEGEISAEDWLGMVAVIQRYQKDAGAVTQRGFNYDWVGSEEGASLALTVNVRNGRSRIRLESNRWMGIFMVSVFCPVFALVFSLSLSKHSYPLAAVSVCLLFGALWFGIVRQFGQHHVQSISGLMERLADEVRSESTALRLESSTQAENQPASREETVRL